MCNLFNGNYTSVCLLFKKESLRIILRSLMEFIPSRFKEINYKREQGKFGQWLVTNEIKEPMLIL